MKIKYNTEPTSSLEYLLDNERFSNEYENKLYIGIFGPYKESFSVYGKVLTEDFDYWIDLENETVTKQTEPLHIRPLCLDLMFCEELNLLNFIINNWKFISELDLTIYKKITIHFPYKDVFV